MERVEGAVLTRAELERVFAGHIRRGVENEPGTLGAIAGPDIAVSLHRVHRRAATARGVTILDVLEENPAAVGGSGRASGTGGRGRGTDRDRSRGSRIILDRERSERDKAGHLVHNYVRVRKIGGKGRLGRAGVQF